MFTLDLGPEFYGFRGRIGGKIVCVATPRVHTDAEARRVVRGLITRQGGDCASCMGCLIGKHPEQ